IRDNRTQPILRLSHQAEPMTSTQPTAPSGSPRLCRGFAHRGAALCLFALAAFTLSAHAADPADNPSLKKATIDANAPGWVALGEKDFVPVTGDADTWSWKDGVLHDTGKPIGVMRSAKEYTNFEFVAEWNFEEPAGNSGFFVWTAPEAL